MAETRLMWHICSCMKQGCICQAAFREPYSQCFDCHYGYHWFTRKKQKTEPAE